MSDDSEREALRTIMKLLYVTVPCCGCCDSDSGYMEVRDDVTAEAAKVGVTVKVVAHSIHCKPERDHRHKYCTYEVVG